VWVGGVVRVHRDSRLIRTLLLADKGVWLSCADALMHRRSGFLLWQAGPRHLPGGFADREGWVVPG
jgi:hypothetical protein